MQANVTNTVALVWSGVGSALGSRVELTGQGLRLRPLMVAAALGGLTGGGLLLLTPRGRLRGRRAVAHRARQRHGARRPGARRAGRAHGRPGRAAARRRDLRHRHLRRLLRRRCRRDDAGAAAACATRDTTVRSIAAKNVLLGVANGVAALSFVLLGPVDWAAVLPMALGFFAGGRLGPAVARRAPARLLRVLVGLSGLGLAAYLALETYA